MLQFVTGDLLKSTAQALVNTVNCEGYMGKGIAYQFKLSYPEMNEEYVKKCNNHEIMPGKLHCYKSSTKFIINFPTKDKWREKSKIEYISSGLDDLLKIIDEYNISSIAIPPLGSGNGGLQWNDVKELIVQKLNDVSKKVDIYIYEPSKSYKSKVAKEPKLSLSALILMNIKFCLDSKHFTSVSLQKTAFFMNVLSKTEYFHFRKAQYGPFDYSIEVICKNIQEFQRYHGVDTQEAYKILMQKLISQSTQEKLDFYIPFIKAASNFTNSLATVEDVEGAGTALYIIQQNHVIDANGIISEFKVWSDDKAKRFSSNSILKAIHALENGGFIEENLYGYQIKE